MDLRQIIAKRIAEMEYSQRQLQDLTGVHQTRISDYLTGKRDMGSDNVVKLLDVLRLEVVPKAKRRKGK